MLTISQQDLISYPPLSCPRDMTTVQLLLLAARSSET